MLLFLCSQLYIDEYFRPFSSSDSVEYDVQSADVTTRWNSWTSLNFNSDHVEQRDERRNNLAVPFKLFLAKINDCCCSHSCKDLASLKLRTHCLVEKLSLTEKWGTVSSMSLYEIEHVELSAGRHKAASFSLRAKISSCFFCRQAYRFRFGDHHLPGQ